jgi:hypothetical protein
MTLSKLHQEFRPGMPSRLAPPLALLSANGGKKSATDQREKDRDRKETFLDAIGDSM